MHFFLWTPMRFVNFHKGVLLRTYGFGCFFFLPFGWSASGNNLKNHLESNPTLTRGLRKTTDPSCHSQGSLKWVWTSNSRYLSTTASFHFHAYGRKSTFFKQNHFTLVTSLFLWVGGHLTYLWFRVTWTHHPKKGSQTQIARSFSMAPEMFFFAEFLNVTTS